MNPRFAMATLAGAVVLFLMGYLLYEVLLGTFYASNAGSAGSVLKDPPGFLWIGIGQLFGAALLALILGWAGAKSPAAGFKIGAIFGLLSAFGTGLTQYGAFTISNLTATIVDPFVQAVLFGVGGAVVGMMLGKGTDS